MLCDEFENRKDPVKARTAHRRLDDASDLD